MSFVYAILRAPVRAFGSHPKKSIVALIVLVGAIVALTSGNEAEAPVAEEAETPRVETSTVAALSLVSEPITVLGEVRSVSQAELRAETTGKVTGVYVTAGATVAAGTVLAELENARERAAVVSAQGALDAAEAQLAKARAGARGEDQLSAAAQSAAAQTALASAYESARGAYRDAYAAAEGALFGATDQLYTNVQTARPSLQVRGSSFSERKVLEDERYALGDVLDEWQERTQETIGTEDIERYLTEALATIERIERYLGDLGRLVSRQELGYGFDASEKAAEEALVRGAQQQVAAARSSLSGSRTALAQAQSAAVAAAQSADVAVTGARDEDIRAAEAAVTQARGGLASARASLEETLVRTPIAGTVTTLNIARGAYVSQGASVAVVANEGALEIEAFVSDTVRDRLRVGAPVLVQGSAQGTVASIAPGLDPLTKQSRVTVGVSGDAALVNGAFVELAFLEEETTEADLDTTEFRIPVTAIKVLPDGLAVFTVEQGVLVAQTITEGPIVGASMLVRDGLTASTTIVVDVRGLTEGDAVTVAQ